MLRFHSLGYFILLYSWRMAYKARSKFFPALYLPMK